ncbi:MAG: hypothetical protein H6735_01740 [Alphaproteobacteria bacterium]|nr:hypothetical protein [Alphaproteobacteria bacterium]
MIPCPACGRHVRTAADDATTCVFCGALAPAARTTVVASLLGLTLSLAGCPVTQELYGISVTDVVDTPTGDTGDSTAE